MPMTDRRQGKVAILYPGDQQIRKNATPQNNRLAPVFQALADLGIHAEPAVYHDEFCDEVRRQLMGVNVVLVWMNPIQDGHDRSILDPILREVAAAGVYVSTHPDIILKMGTKEVVYRTRDIGWGCDTHLYSDMEQMRLKLPLRLSSGKARVLKQYRGNGGLGIWKVELIKGGSLPQPETMVRVRHAKRGSVEEKISLDEFFTRCEQYFTGQGRMIDQAYQERISEGMVRCYLVHDKVAGFGHQAINALYPAPPGKPATKAPQPGPRLYYPPTLPEFQSLKHILEEEWVSAMQRKLDINPDALPVLWDCDFLLGPKTASGEDTYVLCEINVSSVAPFPESAPSYIAKAVLARLQSRGLSNTD
jgi:hypothetical protein